MNIADILTRPPIFPVAAQSKIPWDEPEFSARMLKEHLDQSHDWASRQQQAVAAHVRLLKERLGPGQKRILDLGCGPGLYTQELAKLGHACTGVDFSPAAIAYAQQEAARLGLVAHYELRDIRGFTPQRAFHCVLLTFGEFNVFSREEAERLLAACRQALVPGGFLALEAHTFEAVRQAGLAPATWQAAQSGLFSDRPHLCLCEHAWDEATHRAASRYYVLDAHSGRVREYASIMQAYEEEELAAMLARAGFPASELVPPEAWPAGPSFAGKLVTRLCYV